MKCTRTCIVLFLIGALFATATALAPDASAGEEPTEFELSMVIKIGDGTAPEAMQDRLDDTQLEPLIASRGVYLATGPYTGELEDKGKVKLHGPAKEWAKQFDKDDSILWAEPNLAIAGEDLRFHAWQFRAMPAGVLEYTESVASIDQPALAELELEQAHLRATGAGIKVAVLDTGVDASHEMLAGRVVYQYDFVDDDADASEEANGIDDDGDGYTDGAFGHGTFVAGVVAQVAPDADLYALRVIDDEGQAQLHSVIEAIQVAIEMDVDVINLSFGLPDYRKVEAFEDVIKQAKDAQVLIVAAAGNDGTDSPSYPASNKYVVSVAASDMSQHALAQFSSRGKWVQIAAPGVHIVSSVPGGYAQWAGTSMATPNVTGILALLLDASDSGKPKDAIKALNEGARKFAKKEHTERGSVDVMASLGRVK